MKRINFLYFILMLVLWPAVDCLLSVGTRSSPWFLLALPLYIGWIFFSPFLLYWFRKRRPLKRTFACSLMCELEWGVLWLDRENGELAALFLLNPLCVQYIPLERIQDVRAQADGLDENNGSARQILLLLWVDGKKAALSVYLPGRIRHMRMDGYGGVSFKNAQKFAQGVKEAKRLHAQG